MSVATTTAPQPGDFDLGDIDDPIEFSWEDTFEAFVVEVDDYEPPPAPVPIEPPTAAALEPFAFRATTSEPEPVAEPSPERVRDIPFYTSPLATVVSPLPARPEPGPAPGSEVAKPARTRGPIPRLALTRSAALVMAAATAAGVTNLLSGDDTRDRPSGRAGAAPAISTSDRTCLKEWNTTTSGAAAQLRVTLGQFSGAFARVGRVDPLPGTLMAPDSCALTVYDPATDTNAVFVSGVKDQLGYLDVTSYPRAETYGWPKSERQANVAIAEDGSILAL